jgi:hypothetical protein
MNLSSGYYSICNRDSFFTHFTASFILAGKDRFPLFTAKGCGERYCLCVGMMILIKFFVVF